MFLCGSWSADLRAQDTDLRGGRSIRAVRDGGTASVGLHVFAVEQAIFFHQSLDVSGKLSLRHASFDLFKPLLKGFASEKKHAYRCAHAGGVGLREPYMDELQRCGREHRIKAAASARFRTLGTTPALRLTTKHPQRLANVWDSRIDSFFVSVNRSS
jgi:hypothetical protein